MTAELYDAQGAGTWRAQVDACSAHLCPLHPVRPQQKQKAAP